MQHRLSGGLPGSTAAGSESPPSGSQHGVFDSTDPARVSLTDSVPMVEGMPGHCHDLDRAVAAGSDTGPAQVPGHAVDPEDGCAASAQGSSEEERGRSQAPSAGLHALPGTAQMTAPFCGTTAAADASAAGVQAAAATVAQVPSARPGRLGSSAGDGPLPSTGVPETAASVSDAEPVVDLSAQDLGASQWAGTQAAADGSDGGGCTDEHSAAQPLGLRQVTLQVRPPVLKALMLFELTMRGLKTLQNA